MKANAARCGEKPLWNKKAGEILSPPPQNCSKTNHYLSILTEPVPIFCPSAKMSQRYVPTLNVSPTGT